MNNNKNKSLFKSGIVLSVFTFLSRILGLVREIIKSAFMGTSAMADAFTIAFTIPNLLRTLFAENSMSVAFIPTLKEYLEHEDNDITDYSFKTKEFISSVFTVICFFTSITVALGILFSPQIINIFFPHTEDIELTVILTRIMFVYIAFISIAAFFQGMLNSVKIFSPSGFTPILFNISIITCTYLLTSKFNNPAIAMAIGVSIGGFLQVTFQIPFVLKANFRFKLHHIKTSLSNPGMKRIAKLIAPTIIGMAAYQINSLISMTIASSVGTGILSSLNYSHRLHEFIIGIFVITISTISMPDMTSFAVNKKWNDFQNMLIKALKIILLITIPATFFAFFEKNSIITLVFKAKRFNAESVLLTVGVFKFQILGLSFIAINRILAASFYAQGNTRKPTIAGVISIIINLFCAYILVKPMNGGGISLAISISAFANTVILFIFLKQNRNIDVQNIFTQLLKFAIKIIIYSFIAIIPVYFISPIIYDFFRGYGKIITYGIPIFIHLSIFTTIGLSLLIITKDETTKAFIKKIKQ